jgi:hypothetical protein
MKISNFFIRPNQQLDIGLFEEFLAKSLSIQALNSSAMQKFISLIRSSQGDSLAR